MKNRFVAGVSFLFAMALSGMASIALAAELHVSAAASLSDAFREIGKAFEQVQPDTAVDFHFGASGELLDRMVAGASVDVFVSADLETMDRAVRLALVDPASRTNIARNDLVVAVPASAVRIPAHPTDLVGVEMKRIAIADPQSDPAGRYAHDILRTARVWPELEPRLVVTADVREALDTLARGDVDAAFVFRTDALTAVNRARIAFAVATETPVRYPAAIVRRAPNPGGAAAFVRFLHEGVAVAILERYGFGRP